MSDKMVSVIMASYLGQYPGRASNPEQKFRRAVKSFLTQTYQNKELIIVADGCPMTVEIYQKEFSSFNNVSVVAIPKQPVYSGDCRNAGLSVAKGEIIAYLDNDDVFGKTHLETIMNQFTDEVDMVYYDDYVVKSADFKSLHRRYVELRWAGVGTSSIAHRNLPDLKWGIGYGHDFQFVMRTVMKGLKFKKLEKVPSYLVCHAANIDF